MNGFTRTHSFTHSRHCISNRLVFCIRAVGKWDLAPSRRRIPMSMLRIEQQFSHAYTHARAAHTIEIAANECVSGQRKMVSLLAYWQQSNRTYECTNTYWEKRKFIRKTRWEFWEINFMEPKNVVQFSLELQTLHLGQTHTYTRRSAHPYFWRIRRFRTLSRLRNLCRNRTRRLDRKLFHHTI